MWAFLSRNPCSQINRDCSSPRSSLVLPCTHSHQNRPFFWSMTSDWRKPLYWSFFSLNNLGLFKWERGRERSRYSERAWGDRVTHRDGGGKGRTHEQSSKLAKYPRSTYWAPSTIVGCRKNSKQDTRHSRCGMGAKAFLGSYSVLNPGLSSVHYLFKPQRNGNETRSWRQRWDCPQDRGRNGEDLCKMIWILPCRENRFLYLLTSDSILESDGLPKTSAK